MSLASVQMVHVLCLLALALLHSASGISLEKPVNLAVLSNDLQLLEATYPSPELWPETKTIKYDDKLAFAVNKGPEAAEGASHFLLLDGKLTLAKSKERIVGHELHSHREIHKLYFRDAAFYFDDLSSKPVLNFRNYYIVNYDPPSGQIDKKPAIEYVPLSQFESELMASLPTIRLESQLTGAEKIRSYFRLKSGVKVEVYYYQQTDQVIFNAEFHLVIMTEKKDLIEKCERSSTLTFNPDQPSPILLRTRGAIHSMRVTSATTKPTLETKTDYLKIRRKHLLKDVLEGNTTSVGMVEYDSGRALRLDNISTNGKTVVRVFGGFVLEGRSNLYSLCLATSDYKSLVFFSCSPGSTDIAEVLLQEDEDYLQMSANASRALDLMVRYESLEPYISYISYEMFAHTLAVVSDAMRCTDGLHQSYRLFADVFLIYGCNSGIAVFDVLNIWVDPDLQASFFWEDVSSLSYDSNAKGFVRNNGFVTNFKVRQVYPAFPRSIPTALKSTDPEVISIALDVRSIEWDLFIIRKYLMENKSLKRGVVRVNNKHVLFGVTKSEDTIHGKTKKTVSVSGKGSYDVSCTQECVEVFEIIHDGSSLTTRQSSESERSGILPRVFWPKSYQSLDLKNVLANSYEVRYVKLSTFQGDMRELAWKLQRRCEPNVKFTINVYYFQSTEPVIGYYDCALSYISFLSDFKVMKYPYLRDVAALHKRETLSPAKTIPNEHEGTVSEDDHLRRKFSDYVIQDLLYDQMGDTLHSRSMFLTEVYALRGLPNNKETPTRGEPLRLKIPGGPQVDVHRQ